MQQAARLPVGPQGDCMGRGPDRLISYTELSGRIRIRLVMSTASTKRAAATEQPTRKLGEGKEVQLWATWWATQESTFEPGAQDGQRQAEQIR
eukprot:COSAG05_NODE_3246_length_2211_cov_2.136837_1_plen_93_part_00